MLTLNLQNFLIIAPIEAILALTHS
jgi:hypothetical protein